MDTLGYITAGIIGAGFTLCSIAIAVVLLDIWLSRKNSGCCGQVSRANRGGSDPSEFNTFWSPDASRNPPVGGSHADPALAPGDYIVTVTTRSGSATVNAN
jgi:hypothetical protein